MTLRAIIRTAAVFAMFLFLALFVSFVKPTSASALTCETDQYSGTNTYCSISCGGNTITSGYDGCGIGQYCCAETSTSCDGGCSNGRETYCSVGCGENPTAPSSLGGCGAGRFCCLGSLATRCGATGYTPFSLCESVPSAVRGPCISCEKPDKKGNPTGVWTAIGCIGTSQTDIVSGFLRIGLGAAGMFALLVILASAFVLTMSKGDPKKVEEARQNITAAIGGLLFIIFSMVILRTIGIDILRIPGF